MAWLAPCDLGCVIFDEYLFRPGGQPGLTACRGGADCCSVAAADDLMSRVEGVLGELMGIDAAGRVTIARICTMAGKGGIWMRAREGELRSASEREKKRREEKRKERCLVRRHSIGQRGEENHFSFSPSSSFNLDPPRLASLFGRLHLSHPPSLACYDLTEGPIRPPPELWPCSEEKNGFKGSGDGGDDGRSFARPHLLLAPPPPLLCGASPCFCQALLCAASRVRLSRPAQGLR